MSKALNEIISLVPEEKKGVAKGLITEIDFIKATLVKLRKEIKDKGVVEEFKQGKQEFTRESPALKSYNTTVSKYSALCKQLVDLIPKDQQGEAGSDLYDFIIGD